MRFKPVNRRQEVEPQEIIYPAQLPKGSLERRLRERYGQTTPDQAEVYGASDVGQDASSGGEFAEAQPSRWSSD